MRLTLPHTLAASLLLLPVLYGCPKPGPEKPETPETRLDHFLNYDTSGFRLEAEARLEGQFDTEPKAIRIESAPFFSTPVEKTHREHRGEIRDRDAHFVWYKFQQERPEPRRTVRYINQFGQQSIDIEQAVFLLTPAHKTVPSGHGFPERLDHYKCYEVVRVNVFEPTVVERLRDQFGEMTSVQIKEPEYFCVPVKKEREGEETKPIFNETDHLTFYGIRREEKEVAAAARDQFGENKFKVELTLHLGVPTIKQTFAEHG